ncbi:hypothetical protein PT136_01535 [Borreliella garinii]|uniref:Uncharacterized protein n=1 Tax=Borreliella garinii PBr TaxID=498743 RepID=B7XSX8_BORGR|nr:hypothetical protein [Borreliella garinii]APQ15257.1 hypothetical protein BLA33_02770 [Borreliella garinii]AZA27744.1 hypothetical protein DB281_01510 [Borreliella garinii]EED28980.1 conserved hypothetical protein [Borreliella garinii PBr]EED29866.1 conserved hypothetical protein [Borreliella garinii Far04]KEO62270.1 hypothetical protein DM10_01955 [Borreliella garinii]
MNSISKIEFEVYCILILILTVIVCFNIYLNFRYVVKLREFNHLDNEQENIIDDNLRLLTVIYELENINRIESFSFGELNLEKKANEDINIFVE